MFERSQLSTLSSRLQQPRRFLQILAGPRHVGKTTLVRQAMERFDGQAQYASADLPVAPDTGWIEQYWRLARLLACQSALNTALITA